MECVVTSKSRTNVSVDTTLLQAARALGVNVSATLEDGLRAEIAQRRRAQWLQENRAALTDANAFLAANGLWSDGKRLF